MEDRLNIALLGGGGGGGEMRREEVKEEVKKQLWLAGPLIAVSLFQYCLQMISVMFVGHLGQLPLSGASMATSFASVTGFYVLLGMASALDTYCGQSYGAKQYEMMGIHMQRAMFVSLIVSVPLSLIWANTESILIACGQDHSISVEAGIYSLYMIPSLFAYGLLQCLNKFLQNQNSVFPMMIFSGITALVHVAGCWILVLKSGLGGKGAALATNVSYWVNVVLLGLYVKLSPTYSKTWTGFSMEALHDIFSFFRLAIPSALMVCMEMWAFESMVLLSGLLPNPQLETSVLSISLNTGLAAWMIPYGLGAAVSTRVSNELGAGKPRIARLAVYVAVVMVVGEGIVVGGILTSIRKVWGYAYSNDIQVIKYVEVMLPLVATSFFFDGLQCVLSGNARGCGWQKIGAIINLGSYYLVGIPCAVLFAFVLHIGGKGLWLGLICALIVQNLCLVIFTVRTDWDKEAQKAKESQRHGS